MRWMLNEIQEFLKQDPDLRLLIVEGEFDVDLWGRVVPRRERANVNIYPISSIEVAGGGFGGEKGRILTMAEASLAWAEADRIRYFVDADFDRVTGVTHPPNITMSDGRDAESYVLSDEAFACFCETGAGERASETAVVRQVIGSLLRPMGMLRFSDHLRGWRLPFQDTFADRGVSRFFRHHRGTCTLQFDNLIDALRNRVEPPPAPPSRQEVHDEIQIRSRELTATEDWQIVHGKDLIGFLAWYFEIPERATMGLVTLSIATCKAAVLALPNIGFIERWVRGV